MLMAHTVQGDFFQLGESVKIMLRIMLRWCNIRKNRCKIMIKNYLVFIIQKRKIIFDQFWLSYNILDHFQ